MDKKEDLNYLTGFYRGVVKDNDDPSKLGRIQVNIFGVFDGIKTVNLPWAKPAFPLFTGSGSDFGFFGVPEIDSYVWCFFEVGDIYQPCFFAEAPDGVHGLPSERITNYPDRKVWKTKNGIVIIIDDSTQGIQVNHPTGTYIRINTAGDISISGAAVVIEGTTVSINP